MPDIDLKAAAKALDGWARDQGYSSFDVYIAAGGSFAFCRQDIERQRNELHCAMVGLYRWKPSKQTAGDMDQADYERANARMTIGPEALARAEAETIGEPADPHNAQVQGAEDAG